MLGVRTLTYEFFFGGGDIIQPIHRWGTTKWLKSTTVHGDTACTRHPFHPASPYSDSAGHLTATLSLKFFSLAPTGWGQTHKSIQVGVRCPPTLGKVFWVSTHDFQNNSQLAWRARQRLTPVLLTRQWLSIIPSLYTSPIFCSHRMESWLSLAKFGHLLKGLGGSI